MKSSACILAILGLAAALSPAAGPERPPIKEFLGINGHFTFKPDLYNEVCRLARNYHSMNWDVRKPGDKPTFPLCVNKVDWRSVYGKWTRAGFEVDLCAMFEGFGSGDKAAALWQGQEQWAFDYGLAMAKYFGPSGPNRFCTSIEIGNEPGSGFDDKLYRTIFTQMARGIRQGDSRIKIVTCAAQARPADKYSKELQATFGSPEIQKLFDVINIHTYAMLPQRKGHSPWDRSYPEDPGIDYLKVVDEAIAWRNQNAPGKAIWITEFGYDACTEQAMAKRTGWFLKLNWTGQTELQQAQYLVRSVMCFARRDVGRAYIYYYDDKDEASVHAASGLTRNFAPKPAFWAVRHLYQAMGDYRFSRVIRQADGELYVYEFAHVSRPGLVAWVAWSPTGAGRSVQRTLDKLPGTVVDVQAMPTADGPASTTKWKKAGPAAIELTVSESPSYIFMTGGH